MTEAAASMTEWQKNNQDSLLFSRKHHKHQKVLLESTVPKSQTVPIKTESPVQPLGPRMLLSHRVKTSLSTLTAADPDTPPTPPPAAHTVRPLFRAVRGNKRGGWKIEWRTGGENGGSVTTVDVRAAKERPEGDGGRQECFLCVWGYFISPVSSPKFNDQLGDCKSCSSTERRCGSAWDVPVQPGCAAAPLLWCTDFHLYGHCTCVLLKEQDANTSGASLSCKTRVDLRHQLSSRLWKEALLQRDTLYLDCLGDSERDAVFKLEKWTEISVLQHIVKSTSLHGKEVHLEVSIEVIVVKEDSVQGNWPGRPLNRI